jgi:DNA polymerase-1
MSWGESDAGSHESSGDSHSGWHHKNISNPNAKPLVGPRTRKWSGSLKHHLLIGHARNASNIRELFTVNKSIQDDYLQTRGCNACEDVAVAPSRIHDFTKDLDDTVSRSPYLPEDNGKPISPDNGQDSTINGVNTGVTYSKRKNVQEKFDLLYNKICIVDNVETAKMVVGKLMGEYKKHIHACDTEVAGIDVKKESPVGHGNIICFSIYCGSQADFGNGKSCLWVDVLDGGKDVLSVFAPYFGDSSIRKVWHNYSFDKHIIENHGNDVNGITVNGFHADTMHLARLWNSARSREGYSLEALTKDPKVMDGAVAESEGELITGKESMKAIFGEKKIKKDGTEGKVITVAAVEELQRTERIPWICYSALDSISTLRLWESLRAKLEERDWVFEGVKKGSMYDFYEEYWRPFGDLLVQMESEGMLVDRKHLSEMEKVAVREQDISGSQFRKWASNYCPDACYMNVRSDTQVRQLLFGGTLNNL